MLRRIVQQYWTASVPIAVLLVMVWILVQRATYTEGGHLVYPLDDTYIHMALAKNLADNGSWSMSGEGFQGASSSPLWTVILASLYRLGASREWLPVILNLVFASGCVLAIYRAGERRNWPTYWKICVSLALVLWVPLPATSFTGMEHTLQSLLVLLLAASASEYCALKNFTASRLPWSIMGLAFLAAATRYDDGFVVLPICLILAVQRRWLPAFAIAAASALPIAIYAAFSLSQGGLWAPSSVLVKGVTWLGKTDHTLMLRKAILVEPFHVLLTLSREAFLLVATMVYAALVFLAIRWRRRSDQSTQNKIAGFDDSGYLLAILLVATWLHIDLDVLGMYFRYEAYLHSLGILTLGALLAPLLPSRQASSVFSSTGICRWFAWGGLLVLGLVLSARTALALHMSPLASRNIQQQQYQMALFVREYYPGQAIAVNDIGAIGFFGDVKVVDIFGLASVDVSRAILKNEFSTKVIDEICRNHNVEIAIVYPPWFERFGGLPASWIPVATWAIPGNVICAYSEVTFYAVDAEQAAKLRKNLIAFQNNLPHEVEFKLLDPSGKSTVQPFSSHATIAMHRFNPR